MISESIDRAEEMQPQPTVMRVVPKCSRLVRHREVIQEGISGDNGTLCHPDRTVSPLRTMLKNSVPMLK